MDVEDLRQGWMALVKERLNEEDIFLTSSLGVYLCTPPTLLPHLVQSDRLPENVQRIHVEC